MLAASRIVSSVVGPRPTRKAMGPPPSRLTAKSVSGVADPVAVRPILLHAGETTIQVPFSADQAQQLKAAFHQLYQVFAEKQKATRPKRWDMLEWSHSDDKVAIEVFCNPNAHSTVFDAKLLITLVGSGGMRVTTEARLSAIASDLDNFLQD